MQVAGGPPAPPPSSWPPSLRRSLGLVHAVEGAVAGRIARKADEVGAESDRIVAVPEPPVRHVLGEDALHLVIQAGSLGLVQFLRRRGKNLVELRIAVAGG